MGKKSPISYPPVRNFKICILIPFIEDDIMKIVILLLLLTITSNAQKFTGRWRSMDGRFFINFTDQGAVCKLRARHFIGNWTYRFDAKYVLKEQHIIFSMIRNNTLAEESKSYYLLNSNQNEVPVDTITRFDFLFENMLACTDIDIILRSTSLMDTLHLVNSDSTYYLIPNRVFDKFNIVEIRKFKYDPLIISTRDIMANSVNIFLYKNENCLFIDNEQFFYNYRLINDDMLILETVIPKFKNYYKKRRKRSNSFDDFLIGTFQYREVAPINRICDTLYKINDSK